jgi:hypothetical protein
LRRVDATIIMSNTVPAVNFYRHRIWEQMAPLLREIGPLDSALDFGSGDGWFTHQMQSSGLVPHITAIEVQERPDVYFAPQIYPGGPLPFAPRSFDLVSAIDVMHHCPHPKTQLEQLLDVCGRYFLLKDHTYSTPLGKITLGVLDEIGNRKFGVPVRYRYQRGHEWARVFQRAGFSLRRRLHPLPVHPATRARFINAFELLELWERTEPASGSA